ncbi:uncharacterized protein LOC144905738 [Branchiostoma floridae x Branchiostoma belcheri]
MSNRHLRHVSPYVATERNVIYMRTEPDEVILMLILIEVLEKMARNNNNVPPAAGQLWRSDRVKRKPDWFHRDPRYGFRAPLPTAAAATTTSGLSTPLPPPPPPPAAAPARAQHNRHPRPDLQHLSCRHDHQRQDSASPHRGQPTLRSKD